MALVSCKELICPAQVVAGRTVAGRGNPQYSLTFEHVFDTEAECALSMSVPYSVTDLESDLDTLFSHPVRRQYAQRFSQASLAQC